MASFRMISHARVVATVAVKIQDKGCKVTWINVEEMSVEVGDRRWLFDYAEGYAQGVIDMVCPLQSLTCYLE